MKTLLGSTRLPPEGLKADVRLWSKGNGNGKRAKLGWALGTGWAGASLR